MIPGSRRVAGGALVLATAVHGAVLAFQPAPPAVAIEGGAAGGLAALGTSFADLAAGTASPAPVTEAALAEPVETAPVIATERATAPAARELPVVALSARAPAAAARK